MSVDNLDDTSDSPIQFGLADKSLKILQEHSRRLEAMVTAVKGTVGAGAGGQFSGKFLQIAQQQYLVQKDIARGISQLNITMSNLTQVSRMGKKMAEIDLLKIQKNIQAGMNALTGSGGGGTSQGRMSKIWDFIKGLPGMLMSGIQKGFSIVSKMWEKTGGALFKKTGQMGINKLLGLGGLTIVGALMGKMISSSPLLQAMFKILNTSLTLIMRPIGDFFGSFFRPMFIYFLKEVAIPFFQQGRGWMKEGEKWGRIAVGFFIDPVTAIGAALVKSFSVISGWLMKALVPGYKGEGFGRERQADGTFKSVGKLAEAEFFHKDPAAWLRFTEGITGGPAPWTEAGKLFTDLGGFTEETAEQVDKLDQVIAELEKQTDIMTNNTGIATPGGQHVGMKYGVDYPYNTTMIGNELMSDIEQRMMGGNTAVEIVQMRKSMLERMDLYAKDPSLLGLGSFVDPMPRSDPNQFNPKAGDATGEWKGLMPYGYQQGSGSGNLYTGNRLWDPNQPAGLPSDIGINWWDAGAKFIAGAFSPSNLMKYSLNFIGPTGPGLLGPDDNAKMLADKNMASFERITDSFETMDDWNRQSSEAAESFFKDVSHNQLSTASAIELSNMKIMQQYNLTQEELMANAESLKERLYQVYVTYEAIGRNDELVAMSDQATAQARLLSNELQLGFTEDMLTSTKAIEQNFGNMADTVKKAYLDLARATEINRVTMQKVLNSEITIANTIMTLLTPEHTPLQTIPSDFPSVYGGQWAGGITTQGGGGGGTVTTDTRGFVYGPQEATVLEKAYQEAINTFNDDTWLAGMNAQPSMAEMMLINAMQGKSITPSGGESEFFKYLGPEGQVFNSMSQVPKVQNQETGQMDMAPGWKKVKDEENALMSALGYLHTSVAQKLNEATKKISSFASALTGTEAQVYVKAGGGLGGIAAVESMGEKTASALSELTGVNLTGPSLGGSWMVGGNENTALNTAISLSQGANPAAWSEATGIAQGFFDTQNAAYAEAQRNAQRGGASWHTSQTGALGAAIAASKAANPGGWAKATGTTSAQWGGLIDEPIIGMGMHSGKSWSLGESGDELVTPISQLQGGGDLGNIIIHIGNITKEADYMKLKPLIQRWILEASSRRGMV